MYGGGLEPGIVKHNGKETVLNHNVLWWTSVSLFNGSVCLCCSSLNFSLSSRDWQKKKEPEHTASLMSSQPFTYSTDCNKAFFFVFTLAACGSLIQPSHTKASPPASAALVQGLLVLNIVCPQERSPW